MRQEFENASPGYNPEFVAGVHSRAIIADARRQAETILAEARRQADAILSAAKNVEREVSPTPRPMKVIAAEMCAREGVTIEEVRGQSRAKQMVSARTAVISAVYVERPDISLPQLGAFFRKDHTTILHMVRKSGVWRGFDRYQAR